MLFSWFVAFLITFCVELIFLVMTIPLFVAQYPKSRIVTTVFFVNLISHPIASYLFFQGYNFYLLEIAVVIIEALLFYTAIKELRIWQSFLLLTITNTITAALSFVL